MKKKKKYLGDIDALHEAFKSFRAEEKKREAEFEKQYEKDFGHKRPSINEQIKRINARKEKKNEQDE